MDRDARERFEELVDRLRGSDARPASEGLADAVQGMKPEDLAAQRQMVQDLNRLLARRLVGRRAEPRGRRRVPRPARRSSSRAPRRSTTSSTSWRTGWPRCSRCMRSLTPEQRAELQDTIDALLRDDRLRWDLAQLAANLDQLLPDGLGDRVRFGGDQPLGLEARARAARPAPGARPAGGRPRGRRRRPATSADIDRAEVRDLLGPDAARDLDALEDLAQRLEQAGYLEREGGRMELTPRGSRRIGQKVLDDLFATAAQGRLRRPPARPDGARRRPRGDVQAVRVRRPVPPRPAGDDGQRADARGERAVAPAARGSSVRLRRRRLRGASAPSARRRRPRSCWST